MKFAMQEMKATISLILRKFQLFPADPRVELKRTAEIVTGSATGFQVSIKHREI